MKIPNQKSQYQRQWREANPDKNRIYNRNAEAKKQFERKLEKMGVTRESYDPTTCVVCKEEYPEKSYFYSRKPSGYDKTCKNCRRAARRLNNKKKENRSD